MKVKLIAMTPNPIDVMWTAARTCYAPGSPIDMWNNSGEVIDKKKWNLVKTVLDSGHQSIAEHVYFTFAIEGISRACSHQLVRHRAGIVFSQQSQRYVEIKESKQDLLEVLDRYEGPEMKSICDKYFVDFKNRIDSDLIKTLCQYRDLVDGGCKAEDARNVLPNATKTNITMSINYRELIHICNLRLCTRAQKEIRDLFKLIKDEVEKYCQKEGVKVFAFVHRRRHSLKLGAHLLFFSCLAGKRKESLGVFLTYLCHRSLQAPR